MPFSGFKQKSGFRKSFKTEGTRNGENVTANHMSDLFRRIIQVLPLSPIDVRKAEAKITQ